ncbi:MAG: hypothetical protein IJZ68_05675 [Bacteroidaceae bacterium]|nr:hypothetical protein [Bacteroidaceae bacterium]
MTREAFLHLVEKYEIPLNEIAIVVDKHIPVFPAVSVYQKEGQWVVSECNNERYDSERIHHVGDEEGAFECVWNEMLFRLTCERRITPDRYQVLQEARQQLVHNQ